MKHLVSILFAAACYGQVSSGSLIGDVRSESSGALAGAVVTAEHRATGFSRSATTGDSGGYRVDDLIPGVYSVTVRCAGMRALTAPEVTVEVDQRSRLDIEMQAGEDRDTITVTAHSSPPPDRRSLGRIPAGRELHSSVATGEPQHHFDGDARAGCDPTPVERIHARHHQ